VAVIPKTQADSPKMGATLSRLAEEDPTLTWRQEQSTNQTLLQGMGDQHIDVAIRKAEAKFQVGLAIEPPRVPYRETITRIGQSMHRHKKQTGGAGQFGEVFLRIQPLDRGAGFEFEDAVVGGVIPNQFIPAVEKGVRQVLESGAIAGYPMQDVKATVYDGKYHPVDSKEVAFVTAGKKAFLDAISKARPQVLEPIVNVEVIAPFDNMGDITSSLSSKRARIQGSDTLPGHMVAVKAQVPLSELGSYQGELKSITGGHGSFTMEFSHYEVVPANIQQELVKQYRPTEEE
jgi:elongation factor G